MPGRHASGARKRAPWGRVAAILVVTVAVLAAGVLGARQLMEVRAGDCREPVAVEIAADPALAEVVRRLAATYEANAHEGGDCVDVAVTAAPAGEVVSEIDTGEGPHLWLPASSVWVNRLEDPAVLEPLGQVASSPVVVVTPRENAAEYGWPDGEFSWSALLGNTSTRVVDPSTTSEGLIGVLAVRAGLAAMDDLHFVQALAALSRVTVPSVDDAYDAAGPDQPIIFTATEQSVIANNRADDNDDVVALYPAEGTYAMDYPAYGVRLAGSDAETSARAFVEYLATDESLDEIRAAGFRSPEGQPAENAGVVDGTQPTMPELLPEPGAETVEQFVQQWVAISREMRMLTVVDVSGSMTETVPSGATRIELTRDAAQHAIGLLAPTSEVGLWVFSVRLDPPDHHVELSPTGPLNEELDDGTRMDALVQALQTLPDRVGGGTALYDTTLAAFQHVTDGYDPDKVNSVVILTDGRDEDNPGGIDRETLLSELQAGFDPQAPVPVITIGIGPDADMDALQAISESTGTTAYLAQNPEDIEEVFTRAMMERVCRPNC